MRLRAFFLSVFLTAVGAAPGQDASSGLLQLQIPDVELLNQNGKSVTFNSGVIGDRVAVINTIFTTCTTICPVAGANFGSLARKLGSRLGRDVILVSVSVDPMNDTPSRLKDWQTRFQAGDGWILLTGSKPEVDRLLKSLGLFAPERQDHPSTVLVGSRAAGWTRASALAPADKLLDVIEHFMANRQSAGSEQPSVAAKYFTDVTLIDQDGHRQRFYSDLLKDKVVVINTFFTECQASCPVTQGKLLQLQKWLGDRLGKEVNLLSISVDPANDTSDRLKAYAVKFQARPGWYFLSGSKENVEFVLARLGQKVDHRDNHMNLLLIGNVPQQLWTKVPGVSPTDQIIQVLDNVIKNKG